MSATNYFKGKQYQGTFAGGEGPIVGVHTVNEEGTKGQFGGEGQFPHHESAVSSETAKMHPTGDDGLFDLHGEGYKGPENYIPENKGVVPNFDIE